MRQPENYRTSPPPFPPFQIRKKCEKGDGNFAIYLCSIIIAMWLQSPTNFILFTDAVIEENTFLSFAVNKYKYHDISMIIVFKQLIFALLSILRPLENSSTPLPPVSQRQNMSIFYFAHHPNILFTIIVWSRLHPPLY